MSQTGRKPELWTKEINSYMFNHNDIIFPALVFFFNLIMFLHQQIMYDHIRWNMFVFFCFFYSQAKFQTQIFLCEMFTSNMDIN